MTLPLIRLRSVGPHDEAFLRQVYATTRADEMALVDWDQATREAFLAMQFQAQTTHYRANYPEATYALVLVDGTPAGRLYVARRPTEIILLDIAILPDHRNRGVGTRLIADLLEEGGRRGVPVRLHVERFNGQARSLYERLGFRPVADNGVYTAMVWAPRMLPRRQAVAVGAS